MHSRTTGYPIGQALETFPQAVVALAGARDYYQLPLALHEGDMLRALVTDMYWPSGAKWFSVGSLLPRELIEARHCAGLNGAHVHVPRPALYASAVMKAAGSTRLNRYKDRVLSSAARRIALRENSALFCYSYYASEAFKQTGTVPKHRFLFQLHPHPKSVRSLLLEEADRVPRAKVSIFSEYEASLPKNEFDELASEPHLANGWVVASSYTASTLSEHGIHGDEIHIVPYGVDHDAFVVRNRPPHEEEPFTVCYVGSLVQRKGLSYLLDAVRLLKSRNVRVMLFGRGSVDNCLIGRYSDLNLEINIGVNRGELVRTLHQADVFVLPSLAEGFAHVI